MLKASEAHRATVAVLEINADTQDDNFEAYFKEKIQPKIEKTIQEGKFGLCHTISSWEMSYGEAQQLGYFLEKRLGYRTAVCTFTSYPNLFQLNICW